MKREEIAKAAIEWAEEDSENRMALVVLSEKGSEKSNEYRDTRALQSHGLDGVAMLAVVLEDEDIRSVIEAAFSIRKLYESMGKPLKEEGTQNED